MKRLKHMPTIRKTINLIPETEFHFFCGVPTPWREERVPGEKHNASEVVPGSFANERGHRAD